MNRPMAPQNTQANKGPAVLRHWPALLYSMNWVHRALAMNQIATDPAREYKISVCSKPFM